MIATQSTICGVAEACPSLKVEMHTARGNDYASPWLVNGPGAWPWNGRWFRPDHNPADAILAAEAFGLFDVDDDGNWSTLCRVGEEWRVGHRVFKDILLGKGTFCGAICEAILKCHELKAR